MNIDRKFYSITEAARLSGLSKKALRAGCKSGRFPHTMAGRNFKIDLEGLFRVIEEEGRREV